MTGGTAVIGGTTDASAVGTETVVRNGLAAPGDSGGTIAVRIVLSVTGRAVAGAGSAGMTGVTTAVRTGVRTARGPVVSGVTIAGTTVPMVTGPAVVGVVFGGMTGVMIGRMPTGRVVAGVVSGVTIAGTTVRTVTGPAVVGAGTGGMTAGMTAGTIGGTTGAVTAGTRGGPAGVTSGGGGMTAVVPGPATAARDGHAARSSRRVGCPSRTRSPGRRSTGPCGRSC